MKRNNPFLTITIPVEKKTTYLEDALCCFSKQTYQNFEVIVASSVPFVVPYRFVRVISNRKKAGDVASKRDEVLRYGKGEIFIFSDDDVMVPIHYVETVVRVFSGASVLAACGPLLTPPADPFWQQVSGAVWESYLGSVGAGIYRSRLMSKRTVYDFPAANLIVRKQVFQKIGGFVSGIYPGEDTRLCLDILTNFNAGIHYDPELFVYHRRKAMFKDHLSQIGRYGWQRGWFALSFPKTSFKLQYFMPTIFLVYLIFILGLALLTLVLRKFTILSAVYVPGILYFVLIGFEAIAIAYTKGIRIGLLAACGIAMTHIYYGYKFFVSFMLKLITKIRQVYFKNYFYGQK